jgi:alpha-tubulin suppressor-like RCC1 family protein
VSVDSTGKAHAKAVGRATLRAAIGSYADSVQVLVYRVSLVASKQSLGVGEAAQATATLIGPDGALPAGARPLSLASTDTFVVRVDSTTGAVLGSGHGAASLVATSRGGADTVPISVSLPLVPVPVPLVTAVPGSQHACGLTADGVTYCWGTAILGTIPQNYGGAFLNGPVGVVSTSARFTSLAADQFGTCGWTAEGAMYCWGTNSRYMEAPDTTLGAVIAEPRAIRTDLAFTKGGSLIYRAACGLTGAGELYCWGDNTYGTLGRPSDPDLLHRDSTIARAAPDLHFSTYATDGESTCGIATEGGVWCWGLDEYNLVDQPVGVPSYTPVRVQDGPQLVTLGMTYATALCGATASGEGYCLGNNAYGQLGRGTTDGERHLTFAPIAGDLRWKQFAGAFTSMCGLTTAGKLYCWGQPAGYRGLDSTRPEPVAPSLTFRSIAGNVWNAWYCAVTTDGQTYCFSEK